MKNQADGLPMGKVLIIGLRGIGDKHTSGGLDIFGARSEAELPGAVYRGFYWMQGKKAAAAAAAFDGPVVVVFHSAGKKGCERFMAELGHGIALGFSIDAWLPGQTVSPDIEKVYSIIAGRGGRFHVNGPNVVEKIEFPDETHTSIDDERKLHDLMIKKIGELMNVQAPVTLPATPVSWTGNKFDRKIFFDAVRHSIFGGRLNDGQVKGLTRLLDTWEAHFIGWDMRELAYDLGTAALETNKNMQPIYEYGEPDYFDMYEPGTPKGKLLGNTIVGDGWLFRGAGDVQNTGRGNAAKATKRLNEVFDLGVDLVANPELRLDPFISAMSLFLGNHEGWWTGLKLPNYAGYGNWNMKDARRVVNGVDRYKKVGKYVGQFLDALKLAAVPNVLPDTPNVPDIVTPLPVPSTELTLENLRGWSPERLLAGKIAVTDFLTKTNIIEQERLAPKNQTRAAISLPQNEETNMSFIKTKSLFRSKTVLGIAAAAVAMLFPASKPVLDIFMPETGGLSPETIEQLIASAKQTFEGLRLFVELAGLAFATYGRKVADTKI